MLLNNINYIVEDISHLSLYRVKYKSINNKLILNLDLLVLKYKRDFVYKRIKVFKLNYSQFIKYTKSVLLGG